MVNSPMPPLEAAIAAFEAKIAEARAEYKDAESELDALNREIDTWEEALKILRSQAPTPPPARAERGSVQAKVLEMAANGGKDVWLAEHFVTAMAYIDRRSVQAALAALVKSGKLVLTDGLYRVPETP